LESALRPALRSREHHMLCIGRIAARPALAWRPPGWKPVSGSLG